MKNGSRATIMYEKDRSWSKMKLRKRWQSQDWRQEKMLCMWWDSEVCFGVIFPVVDSRG